MRQRVRPTFSFVLEIQFCSPPRHLGGPLGPYLQRGIDLPMPVVLRVALIFLLVAVLAGGIAMLGNQLGRKIGRRKMTVFGLRPRYTSIFITTMTGSVIACLTLALAMLFSQDIRDAITGTSKRLEDLVQRERQLIERVNKLAEEVRRGAIIWNYGEKIALTTIRANSDQAAVKESISEMIVQANILSITKSNRVALIQNSPLFDMDRLLVRYSSEDFQKWLDTYTMQPQPMGLWLEVTENCMFPDPVPIDITSFPVRAVYAEGQEVYAKEVSPDSFLVNWYQFLDEMKSAALKKGMIEMNGSLGEIGAEPLLEISRKVVNAGGRVRLKAVANRELYQSSNLDVTIEVEPL
jgi:hypothetical protein